MTEPLFTTNGGTRLTGQMLQRLEGLQTRGCCGPRTVSTSFTASTKSRHYLTMPFTQFDKEGMVEYVHDWEK